MEAGVHAFDIHVADRYANDGVLTELNRISKEEASQRPNLAGRKREVAEAGD
jgi:hypothetical protein